MMPHMSDPGSPLAPPALHALFDLRIDGDDALLRLARRRFEEAGLAAEAYGGSFEHLERLLSFVPPGARLPTVHLPRDLDLVREADRDRVIAYAERFGPRVSGFVVHDRKHLPQRSGELLEAAAAVSAALRRHGDAWLYLEYASALELDVFAGLAERLAPVDRVSVCLDVGHIGLAVGRQRFARLQPGLGFEAAELTPADPRLEPVVDDVQRSVEAALPAVLDLSREVARHGKPVHYHLHDGHPVRPGRADHAGFLTRVPVPFWFRGRRALPPLFGPAGLGELLRTALREHAGDCSFTLEIHQGSARLPVDDAADLFARWQDRTNAERMNGWLALLAEHAELVRAAVATVPPGPVAAG
jgi:hypothetical protein